jgi:hypothetical protein
MDGLNSWYENGYFLQTGSGFHPDPHLIFCITYTSIFFSGKTFNLSHTKSTIPTVFMSSIVNVVTIFNAEFVGMCVIDIHIKFQMPNCNGALFITIKPHAKTDFMQ